MAFEIRTDQQRRAWDLGYAEGLVNGPIPDNLSTVAGLKEVGALTSDIEACWTTGYAKGWLEAGCPKPMGSGKGVTEVMRLRARAHLGLPPEEEASPIAAADVPSPTPVRASEPPPSRFRGLEIIAILLCLSAPTWAASTPRDRGKDLRPLKTCAPGQKLIGGKCVTTCAREVNRG